MKFKREHNTRGWTGHTPGELAIQCRRCSSGKPGENCMMADGSRRQRAHQVRRDDARRIEQFAATVKVAQ
jgi:hypothetical protein